MFSRHLCSYKSLLLKYCSTPMVTICCFSRSNCNITLMMTHWFKKNSISRMKSITLVNAREAVFLSISKQRYHFPDWGELFCWHYSESDHNITWALVEVSWWLFSLCVSNDWASSSTEIFLSNLFVVCGLDMGWVWTI